MRASSTDALDAERGDVVLCLTSLCNVAFAIVAKQYRFRCALRIGRIGSQGAALIDEWVRERRVRFTDKWGLC